MHHDQYSLATLAQNSTSRINAANVGLRDPADPTHRPRITLEAMLGAENVAKAWERVRRNNGAAGVDGVTIAALKPAFADAWARTRAEIEVGDYRPLPVRRVEVPKAGGGQRVLGIPAVMDRVVQQALAQVLMPQWEARFSPASYAYRPGRSAHDAVAAACQWLEAGCAWAAHLDVEKFFDRVDHARLLEKLAAHGLEVRLVELVRQFLEAGAIDGGLWHDTAKGTPQGSPLSPLLANIVLDGLDHRLTALGARHVRYADDIILLGRTRTETEAMVENTAAYLLAELNLGLNEQKTRLTPAQEAEFLGFRFRRMPDGRWQRAISPGAHEACGAQVAAITEYRPGAAQEPMMADLRRFLDGWRRYYSVPGEPWVADQQLGKARTRVRRWLWLNWATPEKRVEELCRRGIAGEPAERVCRLDADAPEVAGVLGKALPNGCFARYGLGHPPKKSAATRQETPRTPAAEQRKYPPYAGNEAERPSAQTPPQPLAPSAQAAKRRGWFFNFSLGRLFTFRFLSENAPGVLARPERRHDERR